MGRLKHGARRPAPPSHTSIASLELLFNFDAAGAQRALQEMAEKLGQLFSSGVAALSGLAAVLPPPPAGVPNAKDMLAAPPAQGTPLMSIEDAVNVVVSADVPKDMVLLFSPPAPTHWRDEYGFMREVPRPELLPTRTLAVMTEEARRTIERALEEEKARLSAQALGIDWAIPGSDRPVIDNWTPFKLTALPLPPSREPARVERDYTRRVIKGTYMVRHTWVVRQAAPGTTLQQFLEAVSQGRGGGIDEREAAAAAMMLSRLANDARGGFVLYDGAGSEITVDINPLSPEWDRAVREAKDRRDRRLRPGEYGLRPEKAAFCEEHVHGLQERLDTAEDCLEAARREVAKYAWGLGPAPRPRIDIYDPAWSAEGPKE
jgi:hypothetical protein